MRPAPSGSMTSDIEEAHLARVLLDEGAARLDLVAHQRGEDAVGRRSVLDVDADEHPVLRVHGRVRELLGVHLPEPLEAAHLDALLRELERVLAKLAERLRLACLLAERDPERRPADE